MMLVFSPLLLKSTPIVIRISSAPALINGGGRRVVELLRSLSLSSPSLPLFLSLAIEFQSRRIEMHPPLTLHRHPMCAQIIEEFQKCHSEHPIKKFFGECTDLKIKLDKCFRQEKAVKRKANFEESKKFKEQLQAYRKELEEKEKEIKT